MEWNKHGAICSGSQMTFIQLSHAREIRLATYPMMMAASLLVRIVLFVRLCMRVHVRMRVCACVRLCRVGNVVTIIAKVNRAFTSSMEVGGYD